MLADVPCVLGGKSINLLFDIQFDQRLDESLFSLQPPSGYSSLIIPTTRDSSAKDIKLNGPRR
jgi:hypothetical protein